MMNPKTPNPSHCNWCETMTTETIYWDGNDVPVCAWHKPYVQAEVRQILQDIDDDMLGNAY